MCMYIELGPVLLDTEMYYMCIYIELGPVLLDTEMYYMCMYIELHVYVYRAGPCTPRH